MNKTDINEYALPPGKALALRVVHADRSSSRGFVWPNAGEIAKAPAWDPRPVCGGGLHGWLWAQGNVSGAGGEWGFTEEGAVWLVLEVTAADVVAIDNGQKVKFPEARVLFAGDAQTCTEIIVRHALDKNQPFIAGTATAGTRGTATAGDAGTATAGTRGTATAGTRGTATAGEGGTATAGEGGSILLRHWNQKKQKYVWINGEIGENGLLPDVPYRLDENGTLVATMLPWKA